MPRGKKHPKPKPSLLRPKHYCLNKRRPWKLSLVGGDGGASCSDLLPVTIPSLYGGGDGSRFNLLSFRSQGNGMSITQISLHFPAGGDGGALYSDLLPFAIPNLYGGGDGSRFNLLSYRSQRNEMSITQISLHFPATCTLFFVQRLAAFCHPQPLWGRGWFALESLSLRMK